MKRGKTMSAIRARVDSFCRRFGLELPILLAPMAGASEPALSIAVMHAGGLGACGALLMQPDEIAAWADEVRAKGNGPYQLNLWVPDPPPPRDAGHERLLRAFLSDWGPPPAEDAGDAKPPDFAAQCEALLSAQPPIVSSVMGLFPSEFVARLKRAGVAWFANVSTVAEAQAAEAAGAAVIVAQGMEAGGHRGCFDPSQAERRLVGSIALIPAVADAVDLPVVATGGIGDALESPRRRCSARARCRSDLHSYVARRRASTPPGQKRWLALRPRTRSSPACSAAAPGEALRPTTCWQRSPTRRHPRRRIRFKGD